MAASKRRDAALSCSARTGERCSTSSALSRAAVEPRIRVIITTSGLTRASSAVARPIWTLVSSASSKYNRLDSRRVSAALT